jgi:hypothetical protein
VARGLLTIRNPGLCFHAQRRVLSFLLVTLLFAPLRARPLELSAGLA